MVADSTSLFTESPKGIPYEWIAPADNAVYLHALFELF